MKEKEFKMRTARMLRQEQIEAEALLWQLLRNRNFEEIKFRRQHPIKDYIVGFFSYELRLIIELDGNYHNNPEQKEKDELRGLHLKALGYKVLRYSNDVVLKGKEQKIYKAILSRKNDLRSSLMRKKLVMREVETVSLLSTKKLKPNQRELLLNAGVNFVAYNAIEIQPVDFILPQKSKNIIITSQNSAQLIIKKLKGQGVRCFCVGVKTTALLTENNLKVIKTAQNAADLAYFIRENYENEQFTYFCGKQRRDELPDILNEAGIPCNEVVVYETYLNEQSFDREFDGVLFFSPSGIQAFVKANTTTSTAFCIGETTAREARKYFETVIVSNATTIESTIAKAVNYLKTT